MKMNQTEAPVKQPEVVPDTTTKPKVNPNERRHVRPDVDPRPRA